MINNPLETPATPPGKLYWYRSLAGERKEWAREVIVESKIYMAAPEDYNDPFEFGCRFDFKAPREHKIAFFKARAMEIEGLQEEDAERKAQMMATPPHSMSEREHEAHMEGAITSDDFRRTTGVLSLTELDRHPLMWAHYADAHHGICLEFDTTVAEGSNPLAAALQVNYQADFPVLRFFYDGDVELVNASALAKSDHWQYEKEWRVVVAHGARRKMRPPPGVLTGITLGARISSNDQAEVCSWVARLGHPLELRKAGLAKDRYALEVDKLDV